MGSRITEQVNAGRHDLWECLLDPAHVVHWWPVGLSIEQQPGTGAPGDVGSRLHERDADGNERTIVIGDADLRLGILRRMVELDTGVELAEHFEVEGDEAGSLLHVRIEPLQPTRAAVAAARARRRQWRIAAQRLAGYAALHARGMDPQVRPPRTRPRRGVGLRLVAAGMVIALAAAFVMPAASSGARDPQMLAESLEQAINEDDIDTARALTAPAVPFDQAGWDQLRSTIAEGGCMRAGPVHGADGPRPVATFAAYARCSGPRGKEVTLTVAVPIARVRASGPLTSIRSPSELWKVAGPARIRPHGTDLRATTPSA